MKDYVSIGSTPSNEACAQVGSDGYCIKSRIECVVFANQLLRMFPDTPEGAHVGTKSFPHDFGTYYEVVVKYEDTDESAMHYAFMLESKAPEDWDDEAKKELTEMGYYK